MAKMIILTSSIVFYAYLTEFFIAWYSDNKYEYDQFLYRATGDYALFYWTMMFCNGIVPLVLWFKKIRQNLKALFIVSLLINVGMWFERFNIIVISLSKEFEPGSWGLYKPSWVELGITVGSFAWFFMFFLIFVRTLPALSIAEIKETQAPVEESATFHQIIKQKFIEGGPGFMGIVLLCLILGLALAIERIIYLNMATTDTDKLLNDVEGALKSGGVDAAQEVCRNTKGPVASIFYQGLERSGEGVDMVEKSIVAYGSVQMGLLEKGLSWISLFIALAPMLGFMGTVIGMIGAFDAIEAAGDISPSLVAGGIKVALLTTVFGLIVAMILQVFYNYLIAKVDSIVNSMEDASISLVDLLVKNK
jgi:biopolymer transport protein ExbB